MILDLTHKAVAGDRRALSRLVTIVETGGPEATLALRELFPSTGRAWLIGVTGAPGTGKSTLVGAMVGAFRSRGKTVGVVAVDPSSPFTGGAILGDRVRMMDMSADPGVFMRSMATRGQLGGLASRTLDVTRVLDACGYEVIIVETVGVGQDEVDIAATAHTTALVVVPGLGDDVQALKAGVMEIADVFVVNKADREGADRAVAEIRSALALQGGQRPAPVVRTIATRGEGVDNLIAEMERHRNFVETSGEARPLHIDRARKEILRIAQRELADTMVKSNGKGIDQLAAEVAERRTDPHSAAKELLRVAIVQYLEGRSG